MKPLRSQLTTSLRAMKSGAVLRFGRSAYISVASPDRSRQFVLFGGFRARHVFSRLYLGEVERARVRLRIGSPGNIERCRDLAHQHGMAVFCGDVAPAPLMGDLLAVPTWLNLMTRLPQALERPPASWGRSAKEAIRRVRQRGYTFDVVQDERLVREFLARFHRPSMKNRHGSEAQISTRSTLRNLTRAPGVELLRLFRNGIWVAGLLSRATSQRYAQICNGWRDGDMALRCEQVMAGLYWFSAQRAVTLGYQQMSLGCARPILEDGLLTFKSKWGGRIDTAAPFIGMSHLLLDPSHPHCREFLLSNSIVTLTDAKDIAVFSGCGPDTPAADKFRDSIARWYRWRDRADAGHALQRDDVPATLRPWLEECPIDVRP